MFFPFLFLLEHTGDWTLQVGGSLQRRCSRAERLQAECGLAMTCCAAGSP